MIREAKRWNHNIHYHPLIIDSVPTEARDALDVGCGESMLTRRLHGVVPNVMGIDLDQPSIDLAKDQSPGEGIDYRHGDFLTYPFEPIVRRHRIGGHPAPYGCGRGPGPDTRVAASRRNTCRHRPGMQSTARPPAGRGSRRPDQHRLPPHRTALGAPFPDNVATTGYLRPHATTGHPATSWSPLAATCCGAIRSCGPNPPRSDRPTSRSAVEHRPAPHP